MEKLEYLIKVAKKIFDVMDEDEKNNENQIKESTFVDVLTGSYLDNKTTCSSPVTPTLVPPELTLSMKLGEFADVSYSQPLLLPLRLQALGKLKPVDAKCLSFHIFPDALAKCSSPMKEKNMTIDTPKADFEEAKITIATLPAVERESDTKDSSPKVPINDTNRMSEAIAPAVIPPPPPPPVSNLVVNAPAPPFITPLNETPAPPPPPSLPSQGSIPVPPPPMSLTKGAAPPPPPPLGVAKSLRPKKANTKLKRSTNMGNMYRVLKGKVEGSSINGKQSQGRKTGIGGSAGGKQGMADALAEMTKRSNFLQTK